MVYMLVRDAGDGAPTQRRQRRNGGLARLARLGPHGYLGGIRANESFRRNRTLISGPGELTRRSTREENIHLSFLDRIALKRNSGPIDPTVVIVATAVQ